MTTIDDDAFVRLFQQRFGLTVDGWAGREVLAKLDELSPPTLPVLKDSEIPEDYFPMLAQIESGNRPYIKAPTSSASGLYQFIKSTWVSLGGKWGNNPNDAFGGLRPFETEQTKFAKIFTAKNAAYLRSRKIPVNKASLYAAHFFGPVTAARVLGADVGDRADLIAGPAATQANKAILQGKTVQESLTWLFKKTGQWAR